VRKCVYVLIFLYAALCLRLFYVQVIRADFFAHKGKKIRHIVLPARRGTIYDRNGIKLAVSVQGYDICAHPRMMDKQEKPRVAKELAEILKCHPSEILAKLQANTRFVFIKRRVDARTGLAVKAAKLPAVGAIPVMMRVYPAGGLAANVIGFVNIDGVGIEGLEKAFDKYLRGVDGYAIAEVDAKGIVIPGTCRKRVEPQDGMDIVLTLDSTLQYALEMELRNAYQSHRAAGASSIMLDPNTGEILALANMPTYDPNNVAESDAASRRNRVITDLYEPGSTLKTVTCAAALQEKAIDLDDTFYCRGVLPIGKHIIHCSLHGKFAGGHGQLTVAKVIQHSCNVGAAQIGMRLGKERLHKYEKAFGLYEKPGTGMIGETCGWEDRWQEWPDIRVANISFGQGIAITPLQLAVVYATIANGGIMMHPHIVKEIRKPDGTSVKTFYPRAVRRVVSREVADRMCEMLQNVCIAGTGKAARVDGYKTAGKTGTAQKASTSGHGYAAGKYVASFVGFLPATEPRVVILVAIDEPKDTQFGGVAAAPVFREAGRKAMWYMKVPPDDIPKTSPVADTTKRGEPREAQTNNGVQHAPNG